MWEGLSPPYGTIVLDPPWFSPTEARLGGRGRRRRSRAADHYTTMRPAEIAALPIPEIAAPSAWCFLWVTNGVLARSEHAGILEGWGFRCVTMVTWRKTGPLGLGTYFRGSTEHAVLGVRGWGTVPGRAWPETVFEAPRRAHSQKPGRFYDIIDEMGAPTPRLDVFQRQGRIGWDGWGLGHEIGASA